MPILQSALYRKCSKIATPPEMFGLLEVVRSKLSDFIDGTNGWNLGFQLPATGAYATLIDELLVAAADTTIDVLEVLPMSKESGLAIIGDPLDDTPQAREVIRYMDVDVTGQHQLETIDRGIYGTTPPNTWSIGEDIEQLHWDSEAGIFGGDLSVHLHNWQHKASGGTEPPTAFDADSLTGCVDSNGNLWAFHPTSAASPVWKHDFSTGLWTNPATTGTYTPRTSAVCAFDRSRNKIIIIGGVDSGSSNIATVQIFDVATLAFSAGTAAPESGPMVGDYHETLDRVAYFTLSGGGLNNFRAHEYDIGGDSHTAKAFDTTSTRAFDISADTQLVGAVYNPNDDLMNLVGLRTGSGNRRQHKTYDLNSDTFFFVGDPPVGIGASYRLTIFRDTNTLFLWTRDFSPPASSARKTHSHIVGRPVSEWNRQTDVMQTRQAPIVGYDDESRSAAYFGGEFIGAVDSHGQYADLVGPGLWRPFFQNTVYRTRVFDILTSNPSGIIAGDVTFLFDDIVPAFATVAYEAEHSDSASGPWTPIGVVVDGQKEDIQKQFWRITATITVDGNVRPTISKMEVAYQVLGIWATNPQAVPPGVNTEIDGMILDMPVAKGKVDIETARGSVAGITVELEDNIGNARELQEGSRLIDAEARFFIGYNIPSFRRSDMLPIYSGTISAMDVDFGVVTFDLKDAKEYMRTKLPIGDDASQPIAIPYDVGGISNPALVLRDILEQAGVPDRVINVGSFTTASAHINALHDVLREIEEPRELRVYFSEIGQAIDAVLIADANGLLTLKIYDPTDPPVAIIHPAEQDGKWSMSQEFADKINTETVYGDSVTESGEEVLDYNFGAREQDGALVIADQIVREEILLIPWIGPDNATYEGLVWAREIAVRRLARKKIGVQRLKGSLIGVKHSNLEEGDIIRLVADSFFQRPQSGYEDSHFWPYSVEGQSFVRDNKWVVTSRKTDFEKGRVSLELSRARAPLSVDLDGGAAIEVEIIASENIEVNGSDEIAIVSGETVGFLTVLIDMDQCPDLVGNYTVTAVIPSGAILTLRIEQSHNGEFDPRFERATPIVAVPLTSTTLLDGDEKRRFYAFRLDLDEGSAGAGNGPTISQIEVNHPGG